MKTMAETLNAAADYIEKNGLSKGEYCRPPEGDPNALGPACAIGALAIVSGLIQRKDPDKQTPPGVAMDGGTWWFLAENGASSFIHTREFLRNYLIDQGYSPRGSIVDWSDSAQSKNDVVAVLRAIAGELS